METLPSSLTMLSAVLRRFVRVGEGQCGDGLGVRVVPRGTGGFDLRDVVTSQL